MLSPILSVVESICVVVPLTNKSPLTVKLEPVVSIAELIEEVINYLKYYIILKNFIL